MPEATYMPVKSVYNEHHVHATTLQLCAFARHSASRPAGPLTIRHFDFSFCSF